MISPGRSFKVERAQAQTTFLSSGLLTDHLSTCMPPPPPWRPGSVLPLVVAESAKDPSLHPARSAPGIHSAALGTKRLMGISHILGSVLGGAVGQGMEEYRQSQTAQVSLLPLHLLRTSSPVVLPPDTLSIWSFLSILAATNSVHNFLPVLSGKLPNRSPPLLFLPSSN